MSPKSQQHLTALSPDFVWDGPGWAPKEQHYFLHERPWQVVQAFWQRLVQGQACLTSLGLAAAGQPPAAATAPAGQQLPWAAAAASSAAAGQNAQALPAAKPTKHKPDGDRTTWKVQVAYLGQAFRGWAAQAGCREAAAASIGTAAATPSTPDAKEQLALLPPEAQGLHQDQNSFLQQQQPGQQQQQQAAAVASPPCQSLTAAGGAGPAGSQSSSSSTSPAAGLLLSVEGVLGAALAGLAGGRAPRLSVGGRTDKGVSAAAQLVSFFTCARPVTPDQVAAAINQAVPGALRALNVTRMPRSYHATFSTTWRRYVYLLPLRCSCGSNASTSACNSTGDSGTTAAGRMMQAAAAAGSSSHPEVSTAAPAEHHHAVSGEFCLPTLQRLLQQLEGRELDCFAFARDTVEGKGTLCTLYTARATLQHLPASPQEACCSSPQHAADHLHSCMVAAASPKSPSVTDAGKQQLSGQQQMATRHTGPATSTVPLQHCQVCAAAAQGQQPVVVVELAGNRFLRKMVRVLLSTALREAMPGAGAVPPPQTEQALLYLAQQRDRRSTAIPAPALGLCFAAAG